MSLNKHIHLTRRSRICGERRSCCPFPARPGQGETRAPITPRRRLPLARVEPLEPCGARAAPAPLRERGAQPPRRHPRARRTRRRRPGGTQRGGGGRRRQRPRKAPRSPRLPSAPPAAPPPARPRAAAAAVPAPPREAPEPRAPRPPPGEVLRGRDTHLRLLPGRQPWLFALPRRRLPAETPCRPRERRGARGRGRARIQRPAAAPPAAPPHAPTAGEQQTTTTWRPPPPSLSPPPPRCIMGWRRTGPSLAGGAAARAAGWLHRARPRSLRMRRAASSWRRLPGGLGRGARAPQGGTCLGGGAGTRMRAGP